MVLEGPKKQEGVKLMAQLPDYDNCQCCDLGQEDILRQVALRIYDNFHKPSWRALKHHLSAVKTPSEIT